MTQLYLYNSIATTILAAEGWAATTGYPIPSWAPDIDYIGNTTEEPHNIRASTSGVCRGGLGETPATVRLRQVGPRAYRIENNERNHAGDTWTVILHYRAVGELVR